MLKFDLLTKLFTLGILFSTVVNSAFVAKVLIFGLQLVSLRTPLISEIFFSNSDLSLSYFAFKTNVLVSILFTFFN